MCNDKWNAALEIDESLGKKMNTNVGRESQSRCAFGVVAIAFKSHPRITKCINDFALDYFYHPVFHQTSYLRCTLEPVFLISNAIRKVLFLIFGIATDSFCPRLILLQALIYNSTDSSKLSFDVLKLLGPLFIFQYQEQFIHFPSIAKTTDIRLIMFPLCIFMHFYELIWVVVFVWQPTCCVSTSDSLKKCWLVHQIQTYYLTPY